MATIEELHKDIQEGEEALKRGKELLAKRRTELNRELSKVGGKLRGQEVMALRNEKPARMPINWSEKLPVFALASVGLASLVSLGLHLTGPVSLNVVPPWALLALTVAVVLMLTLIVFVVTLSFGAAYLSAMLWARSSQGMPMQTMSIPDFDTGGYEEKPVPVHAFKEGTKGQFTEDPQLAAYLKKMQDGELGADDLAMFGAGPV